MLNKKELLFKAIIFVAYFTITVLLINELVYLEASLYFKFLITIIILITFITIRSTVKNG